MEVQTRCGGACTLFDSVSKAYHATKYNGFLEKISFDDAEGMHRFRPKLKSESWNPKSEARMNKLSDSYRNAHPNEMFWIDQPMDKFCDLISLKTKQEFMQEMLKKFESIENKEAKELFEKEFIRKYDDIRHLELLDEDDCYANSIVSVLSVKEFEKKYNC